MTEQEQNRAVSDWLANRGCKCTWDKSGGWFFVRDNDIPFDPFTKSLDSCRLFEEKMSLPQHTIYYKKLEELTGAGRHSITWGQVREVWMATPAQRTQAFLMTIGEWKE